MESPDSSPISTSSSLVADYRRIGAALMIAEQERLAGSERSFLEFRERVCTVSTETLESYLEDLFSVEIPDSKLFIGDSKWRLTGVIAYGLGAVLSVSAGLYASRLGAAEYISFLTTVAVAVPYYAVIRLSPPLAVGRRLIFARMVAREIFRRRGIGKNGEGMISKLLQFEKVFPRRQPLASS